MAFANYTETVCVLIFIVRPVLESLYVNFPQLAWCRLCSLNAPSESFALIYLRILLIVWISVLRLKMFGLNDPNDMDEYQSAQMEFFQHAFGNVVKKDSKEKKSQKTAGKNASNRYQEGDVLAICEPWVYALDEYKLATACSRCLMDKSAILPKQLKRCGGCRYLYYCSEACQVLTNHLLNTSFANLLPCKCNLHTLVGTASVSSRLHLFARIHQVSLTFLWVRGIRALLETGYSRAAPS